MSAQEITIVVTAISLAVINVIGAFFSGLAMLSANAAKARSEENGKVADKTHALVNSAMATQLRISSIALRRLADISKIPDDLKAAELAQTAYDQHMAKQDVLDQKIVEAVVQETTKKTGSVGTQRRDNPPS